MSRHRAGLASEHPHCDSIQNIMIILFFMVWVLDSFILNYSTVLVGFISLPIRLFLGISSMIIGGYLGAKSHEAIFDEESNYPKLIDSGVYSWVRHPMYLGILMFCLGFFLAIPSLLSLAVWVVFFVIYDEMATYEEKDLIRVLREEYIVYQNGFLDPNEGINKNSSSRARD